MVRWRAQREPGASLERENDDAVEGLDRDDARPADEAQRSEPPHEDTVGPHGDLRGGGHRDEHGEERHDGERQGRGRHLSGDDTQRKDQGDQRRGSGESLGLAEGARERPVVRGRARRVDADGAKQEPPLVDVANDERERAPPAG